MFFDADRIIAVREMIMADDVEGRKRALAKLLPMQRGDFVELFRIMGGLPVTIRLLDPPLHEFLPKTDAEMAEVAKATGRTSPPSATAPRRLHETNPMLGHRGCRLGITSPEIYEMQARAIFEAAAIVTKESGDSGRARDHDPAGRDQEGVRRAQGDDRPRRRRGRARNRRHAQIHGRHHDRAAARRAAAGEIAETAEFFSFGTNDLTQTCFGLSRDDAGSFLGAYLKQGIIEHDPFVTIDRDGVGELMRIAAERGRRARPALKLGICGEHGGDPASVRFCQELGLDYVSCSPYRVPIARLAAAQAALSTEAPATTA